MAYQNLKARNAREARRECQALPGTGDVDLKGYHNGECVYMTLVRRKSRGRVATASKGIRPTMFTAQVQGSQP